MMAKFRTGAEEAKKGSQRGAFARTNWFSLDGDAGESTILRFIDDADAWITVDQHNFVSVKPAPEGYEGNWPDKMGAICRNTKLDDGTPLYDDECYLCDVEPPKRREKKGGDLKVVKPSSRTWARAIVREEVRDDNGDVLGYRDATEEIQPTDDDGNPKGDPIVQPKVVVVNQGYKNFFAILQGYAGRFGTILDRDIYIKREGSGPDDTVYQMVPLDPLYLDDNVYDLRDPELRKPYEEILDLEEVILERASEQFYARFFDKRVTVNDDDEIVPASAAQQAAASKPSQDADAEKLAAVAARVKGYAQPSTGGNGEESESEEDEPKEDKPKAASGAGKRAL